MLNINQPEDTNTSNILKGFTIFLSICPKTKIISHSGVIDVILMNSRYSEQELKSLVLLGWEELTDYSWRYWLKRTYENLGVLPSTYDPDENYVEDLDEEIGRYYDEEYQIVEERMYDQ